MAAITFPGMTLTGDHASRPAATDVGSGTLYACSTHSLVYQSDGATWATWFTGGSSTSYASNVNAVGEANAGGAASTLTRGDHVHLGVRSVAHASNTFSGPVILTASGNLGITSPTPGTLNFSSQVSGGGGGGSGGSPTASYLGYNTIGGTGEVGTTNRMIAKTFTPGADCLLLAIEVYTRESVDGLSVWAAALHDNNAGAIGTILASGIQPTIAYTNNSSFANNNTVSVPRWLSIPVTAKLTGSTVYWGGVFIVSQTNSVNVFYDGSGNDRRYDSSGAFIADGGRFSQTDTTRQYSIRFLTI